MPRIAISYRREDSAAITGRIFDRLTAQYGADPVFRDIDNILSELIFAGVHQHDTAETDITLLIIGKRWLGTGRGRRRIDDPADPVRVEVETALAQIGKPVIPVLAEGGGMPKADQLPDTLKDLIYSNGLDVDPGRDFDQHIDRLIRNIDPILAGDIGNGPRRSAAPRQRARPRRRSDVPRRPDRPRRGGSGRGGPAGRGGEAAGRSGAAGGGGAAAGSAARQAKEEKRRTPAAMTGESRARRAIVLGSFGAVTGGIAIVVGTHCAWLPQREIGKVPSTRQEELGRAVGDRFSFTSWSSDLLGVSASTLEQQAKWLHAHPAIKVTVRAYCDDWEERTNDVAALALGEARAKAVKNALVGFGVPPDRISTINYCTSAVPVQGATEEAREQNRRAVTTVD